MTKTEALRARAVIVEELQRESLRVGIDKRPDGRGDVNWAHVIDPGVYEHLTCRMLGSRKASKGRDVGRVYRLVGVFDLDGRRDNDAEHAYANDPVRLLADCSIRVQ